MVEHMICEYDVNDKLYHATTNYQQYNKKALILFPGNSWSCWHCGHNEETLEVWLDATEIRKTSFAGGHAPRALRQHSQPWS